MRTNFIRSAVFGLGLLSSPVVHAANFGSAVITPLTIQEGSVITSSITLTVTGSILPTGSVIQITVPNNFFPNPHLGLGAGGIVAHSTAPFALTEATPNPYVYTATLSTGQASVGDRISFIFSNFSAGCPAAFSSPAIWSIAVSTGPLAPLTALSIFPTQSYGVGPATLLSFIPSTPLTVIANTPSQPIQLAVTDNCGQGSGSFNASVQVSMQANSATSNTTSPLPDNGAAFSSDGMTYASGSNYSFTLPTNSTTTAVYYKTSTVGSFLSLGMNYLRPDGSVGGAGRSVVSLANAFSFSQLSVDTGVRVAGQTAVALSPDGSGVNNQAFIHFTPSDPNTLWHVVISSDNFVTVVFDRTGQGDPLSTLVWDGHSITANGYPVVPNGIYQVKVEIPNLLSDTSLSIIVHAAQVSGTVTFGGTVVAGVQITAQGVDTPGFGQATTLPDGSYLLTGLRPGGYHYNLYAVYTTTAGAVVSQSLSNVAVPASGQNFALIAPLRLRIAATVSTAVVAPVYGQANLHTADYSQNYSANIHFAAGSNASDNGDSFNPSSWTVLYVNPGSYVFHLNLLGYGLNDFTVSTDSDIVLIPMPQASISGIVVLPAAVTLPTWIPIQATPQGGVASTVSGGISFNTGQSSGTYTLYAVPPGTYALTCNPQGYIPLNQTLTVGVTNFTGINFTGFSLGQKILGTLTFTGDTTALGAPSFTAWVSAYAPTTGQSNFAQVQVPATSTSTSASYVISGLANGVYQVNPPYLNGFESTASGNQTVTINGTDATVNFTVQRNSAKINLSVVLPNGAVDYHNVHVSLQGPSGNEIDLQNSATLAIPFLGAGYYNLTVTYQTSGAQTVLNTSLSDGQTVNLTADLSALTYALSGAVSIQSAFSMVSSSGGLTAVVNTVSDLLAAATTQIITLGGTLTGGGVGFQCNNGTATVMSTARVEAFPKNFNNYNNATSASNLNCYGVGQYKSGLIQSDGSYSITGLTAGIWEVDVYPYLSNGTTPDVATSKQFITVAGSPVTGVNFALANGYSISGTVSLPTGVSDVVNFSAQVDDSQGDVIQTFTIPLGVQGTPQTSAAFTATNLPSGNYSLVVQDPGATDPNTGLLVTRYVSKPVQFTVAGANLTGINVAMSNASRIKGKIAIQTTQADGTPALTLITPNNITLLPTNFSISAQPNPSIPGAYQQAGVGTNGKINIDANNQFEIDGLLAGIFDVQFQQNSFGAAAQGQGSFNLATYVQGSVSVPAGQTVDLGTITLLPGLSISGNVTDAANHPLPNILVRAQPSNQQNGNNSSQAYTDSNGNYTLAGLSPLYKQYDLIAAPRPSPGDSNTPVPFGQASRLAVDVTQVPSPAINFSLQAATGQLTGRVLTADNGPLSYTDGNQTGYPVAAIYLKMQGDTQVDNPLGFVNASNLDGTFTIPYLVPGLYDITFESFGYGPVKLTGFAVTDGTQSLGSITLQRGPVLTVNLIKPDGSPVNTSDVNTVVAATPDLGNILFGQVASDVNTGNIISVQFAGFQLAPQSYSIILIDPQNNLYAPPEGTGIQFTSNSDHAVRTITFTPGPPSALTNVRRVGSTEAITYYLTRPLRNQPNDQDPSAWLSVVSGGGTLGGYALSGDRRQLTVIYTPAAGEQAATIALNSHTVDTDPSTGTQFTISKTITVLLGQKATAEQLINPTLGGKITLADNNDPSGISVPSNSLRASDGSALSISTACSVTFSATDSAAATPSSAPSVFHAAGLNGMLAWGPKAFLSEAYVAMASAHTQAVNPLSSFYSVLLPAGVSHSLNQTAYLTLSYDTNADPNTINIYYFNGTNYLIQQTQRVVDPVNHTITVGVNHFSTFVVLQNAAPVVFVSGDASANADISVFNFPNPFNLTSKTETLNHATGTSSMSTDGTIIRYSVPAAMNGPATIDIYDVVGTKVRAIDLGTPSSDTMEYVAWDGRNDSGHKVASGVYIGEFKVQGQKRFFKMAVIK